LSVKNENEIAVGNMKVNARGDKLGQNGEVVQKREEATREYYQNNPKAVVKSVSIKDAVDKTPVKDHSDIATSTAKPTTSTAKPSASKTKKVKEVELPNGDIEIQEVEE
jgi:hypothetical protein